MNEGRGIQNDDAEKLATDGLAVSEPETRHGLNLGPAKRGARPFCWQGFKISWSLDPGLRPGMRAERPSGVAKLTAVEMTGSGQVPLGRRVDGGVGVDSPYAAVPPPKVGTSCVHASSLPSIAIPTPVLMPTQIGTVGRAKERGSIKKAHTSDV